jgi:hypothetical protein
MGCRYLNFNELFDTVDDDYVLCTKRREAYDNNITCSKPSAVLIPHKRLCCSFDIVHIAEADVWRLDEEFTWLLELSHFLSIFIDNLASGPENDGPRCAGENVMLACGANRRTALC